MQQRWQWPGPLTISIVVNLALLGYIVTQPSSVVDEEAYIDEEPTSLVEIEGTKPHLLLRLLASAQGAAGSEACECAADDHAGNSSTGHHEDGSHEGGHHQQDALIFLFSALVIGTAVMHFATYHPALQDTVVLFVVGMLFALTMEVFDVAGSSGLLGDSYDMWMHIDPHLLLFTLLPLLLGGDAMCINTSVAQHVGWQCLYLAGPGVLCGAFATAVFLSLYLGWDFSLCMVVAAILCATDPVAVVALLKELGASPTLTVQIQGESLLNDGAAIVLYSISYDILKGIEYNYADVVEFIVKTAMMACALGVFIGYFFFSWIRAAGSNFHHTSAMIQVSLTLCCAYWSFIMAEGVLKISGVLSCVVASLVLAHHMWPHIASSETMHNVWHTFESLGNIIIFFLAGALTGRAMVDIKPIEYVHLGVIYAVLLFVRFCLIWFSRPILRLLNKDRIPVSRADALVMTWGGLRGAVGLALAIQVHNDTIQGTTPEISNYDGQRVLFFVGGIAFLTTIVNATTSPILVQKLGITAMPQAQMRLLKMLCQQLMTLSIKNGNPPEVTEGLKEMMMHMEEDLLKMPSDPQGPKSLRSRHEAEEDLGAVRSESGHVDPESAINNSASSNEEEAKVAPEDAAQQQAKARRLSRTSRRHSGDALLQAGEHITAEDNAALIANVRRGEEAYRRWKQRHARSLLWVSNTGGKVSKGIPEESLLGNVDEICELLADVGIDSGMAQVVNKVFLSLVNGHYWKQIECRDLRPGSEEGKVLLTSIQVALSSLHVDLKDYDFIASRLAAMDGRTHQEWWKVFPEDPEDGKSAKVQDSEELRRARQKASKVAAMVSSGAFNIFISVAILFNGIYVAIEEQARDDSNDDHLVWLLVEAVFTAIFTVEFLLKFWGLRLYYFHSAANIFDFFLVLLGIFGLTTSIIERNQSGTGSVSDVAGIIRLAKVFRVLRFLRVFRLFHAKLSADKEVSLKIAHHMMRISTFLSFIAAQLQAQILLVKYFGGNGRIDEIAEAELGRCILQSQVNVYRAIELCIKEEKSLDDKDLLNDLKWTYERKEITEDLEDFVLIAFKDGAITAREAESIMHPLHQAIYACLKKLSDTVEGIMETARDRSSPMNSNKGSRINLFSSINEHAHPAELDEKADADDEAANDEAADDKGGMQATIQTETDLPFHVDDGQASTEESGWEDLPGTSGQQSPQGAAVSKYPSVEEVKTDR